MPTRPIEHLTRHTRSSTTTQTNKTRNIKNQNLTRLKYLQIDLNQCHNHLEAIRYEIEQEISFSETQLIGDKN